MEASSLYRQGYHPVLQSFREDLRGYAAVVPRLAAWPPVKYYYVDFGISVRIPPDVYPKLASGQYGLDREVPELAIAAPYDPFKVDIFILGNVYRRVICAVSIFRSSQRTER